MDPHPRFSEPNILYTSPSGEHVTARRCTRSKFLQLEATQLKAHITDLESSLSTNKQLLKQLSTAVKADMLLDKAFTSKVIQDLEGENQALEERIRRVNIEKADAVLKAQGSDRVVRDITMRERQTEHPLETELRRKRAILAQKEREVQDIDAKCKAMTEEIEDNDKEKERAVIGERENSLLLTEKYIRMKDILEKLQKELQKALEEKSDLIDSCKQQYAELSKLNSMLKSPITRGPAVEAALAESDSETSSPFLKPELNETPPSDFLMRQLEVLHSLQQYKKISLAITDCDLQPEQRLAAEAGKWTNKIKDLQVSVETLGEELKACKQLQVSLQQDKFRMSSALDTLRHRLSCYEDLPRKVTNKAASIIPNPLHSTQKLRKKGRASSNPLEYIEGTETVQPVPLTVRGTRPPPVFSPAEESEFNPEMPSIICKMEGDEFLQGDSFLIDALRLRSK